MAQGQTIDVSALIDGRKMNGFNARVVIICFFVVFFDGYDIGTISFAGPALLKSWHLTSMAQMGAVFSASLFAILFGGPLFGWVGDRFGRKAAIIGSCLTIAVFSLLTMGATNVTELIILRFLTGLGIGGLPPNTLAINGEFAPKRVRATMMIIMFTGITLGGGVPGPVANALMPTYGWQVLFLIGGLTPIIMAIIVARWLPESIKYLVVRGKQAEAVRVIRGLAPQLTVPADANFVVSDERVYRRFTPDLLFRDGLKWITPLLWILFICNLMCFYFVNTWLPTILVTAHIPMSHAAWAATLFQIGGTVGGLVLAWPMDRMGLLPVSILFVVAIPIACLIGYASQVNETLLMIDVSLAGFTLLGLQFGLNATSAMIYPTSFRSNGSGWAFAVGRCGAVLGPVVAGVLIGMHMSIQNLYLTLAVPLGIGTVCAFILTRLYYVRFQGMGLGQRDTLEGSAAE